MNTFTDDREAFQVAAHRMMTLQMANALDDLAKNAAWKEIRAFQVQWAEQCHRVLQQADTSDQAKAIDALRRWQLADELLRREDQYIEQIMEEADRIRGTVTLQDAELMERFKNEQSESPGDSGGDRTGY